MAIETAKYQFQSWARKGIGAQIKETDTLGNPTAALPPGERATVPVGVSINAAAQPAKDFSLVGPGDIIGVHRDMIVRTEPRNWITNFEPNYLAFIEFYDEDFPWRYTPARPDGDRLRPWLQLLVLEEGEFDRDDRRVPLPVVTVKRKEALPPSDESWLFAHVHTEQEIPAGDLSDLEQYLKSLQQTITTDPDKVYSRLMSPRHLAPNRSYQAFLVPAFEVGRLAGLVRPTAGVSAQKPSWNATSSGAELPFYFAWSFRTGEQADFESLVELLEPRVLDPRIGIRSMDCSVPGFVLVDEQGRARSLPPGTPPGLPAALTPIQGLEGALKTDRTKSMPESFTPNAFQTELQILVNLPETIQAATVAPGTDEEFLQDPVVTLPFYGQNHARQRKSDTVLLDTTNPGWLHALNRDPRTRVPAGFGTMVVQKQQEKFMQRAWQQVQKVYEANRIIRRFQFGMQVSSRYAAQFFRKLDAPDLLAVTAPIHAKILGSPTTIRRQLAESRLTTSFFSPALRRVLRPGGNLSRRMSAANGRPVSHAELVEAANQGPIKVAPPREVPLGIPAVDDLARRIQLRVRPAWLRWLTDHRRVVLGAVLVALLLFGAATSAWAVMVLAALAAVTGFRWLEGEAVIAAAADALTDPARAREAIASTPPRPDFRVVLDGDPAPSAPAAEPGGENGLRSRRGRVDFGTARDGFEAASFRAAAVDLEERATIRRSEQARLAFDMVNAQAKVEQAIDPLVSFPLRLSSLVKLPTGSLSAPEDVVDAMAHPDFEDAMYGYLRDINKELLIPNLDLIPPNTIALLETNPPFIESYLVGLNYEMARELLWREYPTDLRGSYFRQFWEVKGTSNPDTPADAEQLKDITRIHSWGPATPLGTHKPSPGPRDVAPGEKQLVLVIRGDLLKRYPNTVIYAQKAIDDGKGNKVIRETDLTPEQFDKELKFPLFRAEIDPDLRFFGFDLTTPKAQGTADSADFPDDRLGWFFVIQEVPGEPRFGMDISYNPTSDADADPSNDPRDKWNNLAWNSFGAAEPAFVTRLPAPTFPRPDTAELAAHPWGVNAAQMAYILFQTPVMVALHASEMLETTGA